MPHRPPNKRASAGLAPNTEAPTNFPFKKERRKMTIHPKRHARNHLSLPLFIYAARRDTRRATYQVRWVQRRGKLVSSAHARLIADLAGIKAEGGKDA